MIIQEGKCSYIQLRDNMPLVFSYFKLFIVYKFLKTYVHFLDVTELCYILLIDIMIDKPAN